MKNTFKKLAALIAIIAIFAACDKGNDKKQEILNTDPAACCSNGYVFTTIGTDSIFIPNAFTPNGDGVNDRFEIYTTMGLTSKLTINNDTGTVFRYNGLGYVEPWDGTNDTGNYEYLEEGTYSYTYIGLSNNGDSDTINGQICLLKEGPFCPQSKSTCILDAYFSGFNTATGVDSTIYGQSDLIFCN
ncbi:hypothetical protein BH09BAC1_BH09BAC1_29900 [soil metagenome]